MINPTDGGSAEPETGPDAGLSMPVPFDDLRLRLPGHAALAELLHLSAIGEVTMSDTGQLIPMTENALSWCRRAITDRRTAVTLAALGPEWTILHSIPVDGIDEGIDHLVIGPSGVFAITTATHVARNGLAKHVQKLVSAASGIRTPVVAVELVEEEPRPHRADLATIELRIHELLDLLEGPAALSTDLVDRISEVAVRRETWQQEPVTDVDVSPVAFALAMPCPSSPAMDVPPPAGEAAPADPSARPAGPPRAADPSARPAGPLRGTSTRVEKITLVLTAGTLALPVVAAVLGGALTLVFGLLP